MNNSEFESGIEKMAEEGVVPENWEILKQKSNPAETITYLDLETPNARTFVKIFEKSKENQALHESQNTKYFESERGWLSPELLHYVKTEDKSVLAYELIEGNTLHEQFGTKRNNNEQILADEIYEPITQIANLSKNLSLEETKDLYISPLRKPYTFDLLTSVDSSIQEQDLKDSWNSLLDTVDGLSTYVPGFFFDRNPRNMIKNDSGIYQVDTEIIASASPLLDLSIFLRTGYDVESHPVPKEEEYFDVPEERKRVLDVLGVFSEEAENEALVRFSNLTEKTHNVDLNILKPLFNLSNIFMHIYFLRFPLENRINNPQKYKAKPRHLYHAISALEGIDKILEEQSLDTIHNLLPDSSLSQQQLNTLSKAIKTTSKILIN